MSFCPPLPAILEVLLTSAQTHPHGRELEPQRSRPGQLLVTFRSQVNSGQPVYQRTKKCCRLPIIHDYLRDPAQARSQSCNEGKIMPYTHLLPSHAPKIRYNSTQRMALDSGPMIPDFPHAMRHSSFKYRRQYPPSHVDADFPPQPPPFPPRRRNSGFCRTGWIL